MENWSAKWCEKNLASHALPLDFYQRSTVLVARELLGKIVTLRRGQTVRSGRIVETEAYRGVLAHEGIDPASHSARGWTKRSAPMFESPGRAYVYLIYGIYWMLNFVTEPEANPGAVLIRALEPLSGKDDLSGPGKLARALGVSEALNRASLQGPDIWVRDDGMAVKSIAASPRVGIRQGQNLLWRFFTEGSSCVSRVPQNRQSVPVERWE